MKPLLIGIGILVLATLLIAVGLLQARSTPRSFGGGSVSTSTVSVLPPVLSCTSAAQGPKYDTPSGYLEPGYYDPILGPDPTIINPSGTTTGSAGTSKAATRIGEQAWMNCTDGSGTPHVYAISTSSYDALSRKGAVFPNRNTLVPLFEVTLPGSSTINSI